MGDVLSDLAAITLQQADFFTLSATAYNAEALQYGVPPVNLGRGSSFGPIFRGFAQTAFQIQGQVSIVANAARLATSSGADVDSFVNPFGIVRQGATYATGPVVYSQPSPVPNGIFIPLLSTVETADGRIYVVVSDPSQASYVAPDSTGANGGYRGAPGTSTLTATVTAQVAGSASNCNAGDINVVYGGPGTAGTAGLSVINQVPFTNALDEENDNDLKTRFEDTLAGAAEGTPLAIVAAVLAVQPGQLVAQVGSFKDQNGNYARAFVSVFVNSAGSGVGPSQALLDATYAAVAAVIAGGIGFGVYAPRLQPLPTQATLVLDGTVPAQTVIANAQDSYNTFVNGSGLDPLGGVNVVPYMMALDSLKVAGVKYVSNMTFAGGYADVSVPYGTQAVAGPADLTAA